MSLTAAEKYAGNVQQVPWSAEVRAEFERNQYNGCVGSELVSENESSARVDAALGPRRENRISQTCSEFCAQRRISLHL